MYNTRTPSQAITYTANSHSIPNYFTKDYDYCPTTKLYYPTTCTCECDPSHTGTFRLNEDLARRYTDWVNDVYTHRGPSSVQYGTIIHAEPSHPTPTQAGMYNTRRPSLVQSAHVQEISERYSSESRDESKSSKAVATGRSSRPRKRDRKFYGPPGDPILASRPNEVQTEIALTYHKEDINTDHDESAVVQLKNGWYKVEREVFEQGIKDCLSIDAEENYGEAGNDIAFKAEKDAVKWAVKCREDVAKDHAVTLKPGKYGTIHDGR